jgi:PAS domain S-box-containing protein
MKKNPNQPAAAAELRRRAEERLRERRKSQRPEAGDQRRAEATTRLVHELQVHQIELEMQNEELRQARAQAEALLAQYTDLYDFAPVGYLTLNEPGLILRANLTAARLLGVARKDLVRQRLTRFILREDLSIFNQHHQQLLATRAPQNCRLRLKRPGGTPLWVRLDASVTPGSDAAAPVCRMTLSDLTERKQAEADHERVAQFERLAQLMKCASDIILLTNEDGQIIEANDRALETYGYSPAELRQQTIEDLRTPESRAELPQQTEQLETDGRAVFEAMHQRRDGVAFPVEISARFLQIAGVRYRLDIVRDITKRKRAEAALQESEERYRSLFSSSLDAVLLTMPDGRILAANEAACHIFGFSEEELIQVGRSAIVDASDPKLSAALAERAQSGRFIGELTLVRRDGSKFPGEISSAEFRNRAGELRTSMVIRDITERKQAEELLRIQHDLALAFSNASRLKEGLRLCLEAVLNILGMECGGFYLVDRTSGALDLAFHQGLSPGFVKAVAHYAADSANAKLVMAGKPVYGEYPVFRVPLSEAKRHEGLRAVAIVPVSHQAQVIGCLNIASHRPGEVPASARAVLEAVVAQTGAAIVRLRAEEVLRASERKFHTLADNFPEIIARFDRQLRHIYVSPSVEQYAGLPIKAFQGKTNEELGRPPENVALWSKRLRRVFKTGERESFEFEFRKAGRLQVFASLLVPEFGKDGAVESVMGIIRDISERKRAEERVRMFAQEIIAAREEERKKVASVLHHDVGSLAVGISAYLDLMEEHIRSGKPREALKLMRRTRKLFYQSVARLKGLAVELRPPELDAIGLCGALRQYFSPSPRHGDTRIHFKESLGRRQVPAGSATILFRVAQEALTNAIAHGRAQQVNVDLRAAKEELTLTVHDNGNGFNPSEQMARPTSQMGLRVMREMVLSVGGDFTIDSGRGKGTTVRVRLPIADRGLRNAECGLKEMTT